MTGIGSSRSGSGTPAPGAGVINEAGEAVYTLLDYAQERRKLGRAGFEKRYPHPFLVTLNKRALAHEALGFRTVAAPMSASAVLEAGRTGGPQDELAYPVVKSGRNTFASQITIGRARNNDLIIRSSEISKGHAALLQVDPKTWQIIDLGSTNGTVVGGERLSKGAPVRLRDGDAIALGQDNFEFLMLSTFCDLLESYRV